MHFKNLIGSTGFALALCMGIMHAQAVDLRAGLSSEPTSIDPHYHNLTPNNGLSYEIFDALANPDTNQKLHPGLAESWTAVDETTWEFKLRKNVKFHDGSPFTADDVVFSFDRAPNVPNSPSSFRQYILGKTVKKIDDHTVHFITEEPQPLLPVDVSRVFIVSKLHVETATTEDFNTGKAAIGTGRYKFQSWNPGDSINLVANADYWGGKPKFDTVTMKPIKQGTARVAALLAGDVDFIEQVPPTDVPHVKGQENVKLFQNASSRLIFLGLDQFRETSPQVRGLDGEDIKNPFLDQRVRLAVSHAINREAIVDRIMGGLAVPAGQLAPKDYVGYTPELNVVDYDPERAKELLAEAGYGDGFRLTIHGPNDRYVNDAKILEAVAQMLNRVGIQTDVETMSRGVFFNRASRGGENDLPEFSLFLVGWANGSGEASNPLRGLIQSYDKDLGTGPSNRGRYKNVEVDGLIQTALREMDPVKRDQMFIEATKIAMGEIALIPLHHQISSWATNSGYGYMAGIDERTQISRVTVE